MGILEEVNASYEKLSPVQKRIADFIFKYPDQVCFYSLKELSETLGVTEVTILRFTKKIGAQSFVEMKNRLREHLQTRLVHGDGLNRIADHVGGIRFGDHDDLRTGLLKGYPLRSGDHQAVPEDLCGGKRAGDRALCLHDEKTLDIGAGGARSLESEPGSLQ